MYGIISKSESFARLYIGDDYFHFQLYMFSLSTPAKKFCIYKTEVIKMQFSSCEYL
jgi:hypothetical protein